MEPTAQDIFDQLSAPFAVDMIEWRVGSTNREKTRGLPLCYIDARSVMDRLDAVCGPDGWQCNYSSGVNGSIVCNIGILVPSGWIWKADGAGETDYEASKGALSDAFKRAAVRWGVGRYLYDLKAPWVPLKDGKHIPDDEMKKLDALHEDFALKAGWGMRAGVQAYKVLNEAIKHWVLQPGDAAQFREQNKGMIAQLPVAMRRHLNETLDRIGTTNKEAA